MSFRVSQEVRRKARLFVLIFGICLTHIPSRGYSDERATRPPFIGILQDCAGSIAEATHTLYTLFRPAHALSRFPVSEAPSLFKTYSAALQARTIEYFVERLQIRWATDGFSHLQVNWLLAKLLRQVEDPILFLREIDRIMALIEAPSDENRNLTAVFLSILLGDPATLKRLPIAYAERVHSWAQRDPSAYRDALVLVLGWQLWGCEGADALDTAKRLQSLSDLSASRRLFVMVEAAKSNGCLDRPTQLQFENEFHDLSNQITQSLNPRAIRRWQKAREVFSRRASLSRWRLHWVVEGEVLSVMNHKLQRRAFARFHNSKKSEEQYLKYIFADEDLRQQGFSQAILAADILINPEIEKFSFSLAETNRRIFVGAGTMCGPNDPTCPIASFQRTPISRALTQLGFTNITHMDLEGRFPRFSVEWAD